MERAKQDNNKYKYREKSPFKEPFSGKIPSPPKKKNRKSIEDMQICTTKSGRFLSFFGRKYTSKAVTFFEPKSGKIPSPPPPKKTGKF